VRRARGRRGRRGRRRQRQERRHRRERPRVVRAHLKQHAGEELPDHERGGAADRHARERQPQRTSDDHCHDLAAPGAKRHADRNLPRPLPDQVRQHAVNPDCRQKQRQQGKPADEPDREPPRPRSGGLHFAHRPHGERRLIRVDGPHGAGEGDRQRGRIAARAQHEPHRQARGLRQRPVDHRARADLEILAQHVPHHADDGHPGRLRARRAEMQPAADRVLSGEVLACRLFVDDRDERARVGGLEHTAPAHGNTHQREVVL